tara:strand:+ start:60 stop:344 length:285 start_codon:yes stop_codon:yes gene_type:complete
MRNFFILYNIIFLFFGNILFSSVHYLNDHVHDDKKHQINECLECISYNNAKNYILDYNEINFIKYKSFQFIYKSISIIELNHTERFHARAPPVF